MSVDVGTVWHAATVTPPYAAPLRAVDGWSVSPTGITSRVAVRGDDPNLRGHFPGLAVFPGIFVIEAVTQAVRLGYGDDLVLREVRSVRFLAPLLDGDELALALAVTPGRPDGWSVRAEATRRDGVVAARLRAEYQCGYGDA